MPSTAPHLSLVPPPPSPEERALHEAILAGYATKVVNSLHLTQGYLHKEQYAQREFLAGHLVWDRTPVDMDRYSRDLVAANAALNTLISKQGAIRRLYAYATHPGYDWVERCLALTGRHLRQVCTFENTVAHQRGISARKRRRIWARELDRLFITSEQFAASAEHEDWRLDHQTYYAILATGLATGAREQELAWADLDDLWPAVSATTRKFSPYEQLYIRYGKRSFGSDYKARPIPALAIFSDAWTQLGWYVNKVRPLQAKRNKDGAPPALFLNARGKRLRPEAISAMFKCYRDEGGLSDDLSFHCVRHTFSSLLRERGLPLAAIKELLGHSSEATSVIYSELPSPYLEDACREFSRAWLARAA